MYSKLIVKRHDSGWSPLTLEWLEGNAIYTQACMQPQLYIACAGSCSLVYIERSLSMAFNCSLSSPFWPFSMKHTMY